MTDTGSEEECKVGQKRSICKGLAEKENLTKITDPTSNQELKTTVGKEASLNHMCLITSIWIK